MRIWLLIAFVAVAAGCGVTEMFNTDPGIDVKRLPDGRTEFLDTPRMWQRWTESVDSEIPREANFRQGETEGDPLHGMPQGGGAWNDYWLRRIRAINNNDQEHPQRYIDYIIERRRAAGLPELTGYP